MSMPGKETDEGREIQDLRRSAAAPILKRVPGLRPAQDKNVTLRVSKIIRILGGYKGPIDSGQGLRMGTPSE
jgi:hypothetical protein